MSSGEANKEVAKSENTEDGGIPLLLLKSMRKGGGESGGSSNGENNSDNSALVSIGNTSFGFNFDSEEQTPNNSDRDRNENSEDSDDQQRAHKKAAASTSNTIPQQVASATTSVPENSSHPIMTNSASTTSVQHLGASLESSLRMLSNENNLTSRADAMAILQAIAARNLQPMGAASYVQQESSGASSQQSMDMQALSSSNQKRKATDEGDSSAGYHTDDEGRSETLQSGSGNDETGRGKKKKRVNERKREERNLREKERSLRISKQINDLRDLLSSGGVIVPKGTKSSVLTEAANYIRMLQQHQYRSELDRHQLIQQVQMIGNGAHGAQAARAIRHVAAQNGVWSLGNFGGVPPNSALSLYNPPTKESDTPEDQTSANPTTHPTKIETSDYKVVFNSCGVGIAIASLGGAFIDCNHLFAQLSNYSKQEICSLTIFNLTARQDLQHAFDLISQMISPPIEARNQEPKPIVLRGSMKSRTDLGLCISLVRGEDGIARCFCVTLIKNPSSPFDSSRPIPVSFDAIQTPSAMALSSQPTKSDMDLSGTTPAFTLG